MGEIKEEVIALCGKLWTWACLILLGMVGMISTNMYVGKKMTFKQALGSFGVSFFIGSLTSILCYVMEWERMSFVLVPFATLISDKVIMGIMAFNWQHSIKEALKDYIKNLVKKWK